MQPTHQSIVWLTAAALLAGAPAAAAQGKFRFQLKPDDKLHYESTFEHTVETRVGTEKQSSKSSIRQLKRWHVREVDALGVAAMELTVLSMKLERTDAAGKPLVFDSADQAKSDEQLWKQLRKAVGRPILRVQLAANGSVKAAKQLTEVKSLFPELPFQIAAPDEYPHVGLKWKRDFAVTLDAPFGKGEGFKAEQVCTVTKMTDDRMQVDFACALEKEPTDPTALIALGQFLPKGKVVLDAKRGLLLQAVLEVERTVPKFDGDDSEYKFVSKTTERYVEAPTGGSEP